MTENPITKYKQPPFEVQQQASGKDRANEANTGSWRDLLSGYRSADGQGGANNRWR